MEREIDSLIGKHNETISRLDQGIKHITELAVAFEQAGQHDRVNQLEESVTDFIKHEIEIRIEMKLLSVIKQKLAAGDVDGARQLHAQFAERIDQDVQKELANIQRHEKFKAFRRSVWEVNHQGQPMPGDEDEILLYDKDADRIPTCPITRAEIKNPMTNRGCGHKYSKIAIEKMLIEAGGSIVCPVAGCSVTVTRQSLVPDTELEKRIAKLKKKAQRRVQRDAEKV